MTRSEIMSRIRSKATGPERRAKAMLAREGEGGFKMNVKGMPGTPDFVFFRRRTVLFIDGCFWHGHSCGGKLRDPPKTNTEFWTKKIWRNRERDMEADRRLSVDGWWVVRVPECRLRRMKSWELAAMV